MGKRHKQTYTWTFPPSMSCTLDHWFNRPLTTSEYLRSKISTFALFPKKISELETCYLVFRTTSWPETRDFRKFDLSLAEKLVFLVNYIRQVSQLTTLPLEGSAAMQPDRFVRFKMAVQFAVAAGVGKIWSQAAGHPRTGRLWTCIFELDWFLVLVVMYCFL